MSRDIVVTRTFAIAKQVAAAHRAAGRKAVIGKSNAIFFVRVG